MMNPISIVSHMYAFPENFSESTRTCPGKVMERSWKGHGKVMESSWKGHGKFMERSWKVHGIGIAYI